MLNNKYKLINCLSAAQKRTHSLGVLLWHKMAVKGGRSSMTQLFALVNVNGHKPTYLHAHKENVIMSSLTDLSQLQNCACGDIKLLICSPPFSMANTHLGRRHCPAHFQLLTNSSSILVWHFSRLIRLMATFSFLGLQNAACTTAVAPLPEEKNQAKSSVLSSYGWELVSDIWD